MKKNKLNLSKSFQGRVLKWFFLYKPSIINIFLKPSKRDVQLFCIGLPRSGTHTLRSIFVQILKAAHEPLANVDLPFITKNTDLLKGGEKLNYYLKTRDNYLNLEVEATHYLINFLPSLVESFPQSKFLITIREPVSWLGSFTNLLLRLRKGKEKGGHWISYKKFLLGEIAMDFNINSVDDMQKLFKGMLDYSLNHFETAFKSIPTSRMLVVDTFKIKDFGENIAYNFLGLSPDKVIDFNIHSGKIKKTEFSYSLYKDEEWFKELIKDWRHKFLYLINTYKIDPQLLGEPILKG